MYCNTILLHCIGNFWSYLWYSHVYALYFQKSAKIVEFKPYIYAINDASSAWCMAVISRFIRILLLLPYCSLVPFCRFIRILREFFLLHELDSTPVFFTARTRFNVRSDPGQPEQKTVQSDNRGTPLIWIRALTDNRGTALIWIRALKKPPLPKWQRFFSNYRTALRSRIAHSCQKSGWSNKKYVAVLVLQCSINASPLRAVNCIEETSFRQTAPLTWACNHEAEPVRMANSNAWMCSPAFCKTPNWPRSTKEFYVHTCRLVRTGTRCSFLSWAVVAGSGVQNWGK